MLCFPPGLSSPSRSLKFDWILRYRQWRGSRKVFWTAARYSRCLTIDTINGATYMGDLNNLTETSKPTQLTENSAFRQAR